MAAIPLAFGIVNGSANLRSALPFGWSDAVHALLALACLQAWLSDAQAEAQITARTTVHTIAQTPEPTSLVLVLAACRRWCCWRGIAQDEQATADSKGLRLRRTALAVQADPVPLAQILRNLVRSALHITARGGVLVLARARAPCGCGFGTPASVSLQLARRGCSTRAYN